MDVKDEEAVYGSRSCGDNDADDCRCVPTVAHGDHDAAYNYNEAERARE